MGSYEQVVLEVVRQEFGEPVSLRFVEVWGPRVVGEVTLADSALFVKAAGDADVRAEVAALRLASSVGVPVPELVGSGAHVGLPGGRWIATRRAPGEPWRFDDVNGDLRLPSTAGRTLRDIAISFGRLHGLRLDGFGPLTPAGVGCHRSWGEWLGEEAEQCLKVLVGASHVSTGFARLAIDTFARSVPALPCGTLLHGDLGNSETFVDPEDGTFTCMVDWGGALVGDPIYEFARFNGGGPADDPRPAALLPELIEHYVTETGIERERVRRALPLYQAHNAITNAVWSYREGVPWIPALLEKAEVLLRRAR